MYQYAFVAVKQDGERSSGVLAAQSKDHALKLLSDKNLLVTKLTVLGSQKRNVLESLGFASSCSGEELVMFTQELSTMLNAGLSLPRTFQVAASDMKNVFLRKVITEIGEGIVAGISLSDLMKAYPAVFSRFYISLVEAGETNGNLAEALSRLAQHLEKIDTIRKKIKAAFYYPAIVVCFAGLVLGGILVFGIPQIQSIYSSIGGVLPLPTRIIVNSGDMISKYWFFSLIVLLVIFILLKRVLRTPGGQIFLDNIKLRTFFISPLVKCMAIANFSNTLSVLYGSGVPLTIALDVVSRSMGNRVLEKIVINSLRRMKEGGFLSEPLRLSGVFTNMSISMISVGEESGTLETMLRKLGNYYDVQVDLSLKAISDTIEPLIMIAVGVFLGTVIVCLALPFMNIGTMVQQ